MSELIIPSARASAMESYADYIYDPAMAKVHVPSPHQPVTQLVTGLFHRRRGYSAWRSHGTNDWLIICTLGGRGRFGFAGGEIITRTREFVLLRPGTPHDYGVESQFKRWDLLWAHFQPLPHWMPWLNWPQESPGLMRLALQETNAAWSRAVKMFHQAHAHASSGTRRETALAMNALEAVLLWCDTANRTSQSPPLDSRIQTAINHVNGNLAMPLTLESLAEVAGISVSRFAHLFREQIRIAPQQFVETQRINRARQLLALTGLSVKEVAAEVGFASPFYLSLRFKRQTGFSPSEYRLRQAVGSETVKQRKGAN